VGCPPQAITASRPTSTIGQLRLAGAREVCRLCETCEQRVTWRRALVSRSWHTHVADILGSRTRSRSLSFADARRPSRPTSLARPAVGVRRAGNQRHHVSSAVLSRRPFACSSARRRGGGTRQDLDSSALVPVARCRGGGGLSPPASARKEEGALWT